MSHFYNPPRNKSGPSAKDVLIKPIAAKDANAVVQRLHYSGKIVRNSSLHLGAFINGQLEGAMQFGPSLDKSNMLHIVEGTKWNGFLELNRMAFSEALPRNSESRALGIAMRMIKKHYPHIEWVVSFADACQCGDGTIYRAAGFVLTRIKVNKDVLRFPDGSIGHKMSQVTGRDRLDHFAKNGGKWSGSGEALPGFMMRYIYFLAPGARERLVGETVPYSQIVERGASMYRGKARGKQAMSGVQLEQRRSSTDPHAPTLEREDEMSGGDPSKDGADGLSGDNDPRNQSAGGAREPSKEEIAAEVAKNKAEGVSSKDTDHTDPLQQAG